MRRQKNTLIVAKIGPACRTEDSTAWQLAAAARYEKYLGTALRIGCAERTRAMPRGGMCASCTCAHFYGTFVSRTTWAQV